MDEQPEPSKNSGCCTRCSRCCNCCGRCCICGVDEETKKANNVRNWKRAFGLLGMLALIAVCISYVAGYYGIIILNFTFFYVTLIMYIIVPVRAVMSNDLIRAGLGLVQVFCYAPYIQFFLYFLICSVSTITGTIPVFIEMLLTGKLFRLFIWKKIVSKKNDRTSETIDTINDCKECMSGSRMALTNFLVSLGWLALATALGGYVYACMYAIGEYILSVIGCLFYAPFVFEMGAILICVYEHWFWALMGCKRRGINGCGRIPRKFINWIKRLHRRMMEIQKGYLFNGIKQIEKAEADQKEVIARNKANSSDSSCPETVENTEQTKSDEKTEKDSNGDGDLSLPVQSPRKDKGERMEAEWQQLKGTMLTLIFPGKYTQICDLSDALYHIYKESKCNRFSVWIATLLNIALIAYDVYECVRGYSKSYGKYFISGIGFRILFLPAASYFHQGIVFMKRNRWREAAGSGLRRSVYFIGALSAATFFGCIVGWIYVTFFMNLSSVVGADIKWPTGQRPDLNFTHGDVYPTLCAKNYHGASIIDIVGTTFGVYEIVRDRAMFSLINEHLYPGWDYNTSTEAIEIDVLGEKIPMALFNFDNLTVWSLRGFASGPELAAILELFCSQYIIPFFQSFAVFLEYIQDWFLSLAIPHAYSLGVFCFTPETVLDVMVNRTLEEYHKRNFTATDNVVFVGINTGGVVAKILGMKTGHLGFAYLSFNAFTDLLQYMRLDEDNSWLIVNMFHRGGWFSVQEPNLANNIILPSVIDSIFKDDKRPTFCTMALSCSYWEQYDEFCRQLMGDEFVAKVYDHVEQIATGGELQQ